MNRQLVKNLSIRLGMVFGSLVITLLILEVVVRFFFPQQLINTSPEVFQPHDGLGHTHRAHVDTVINFGDGSVRFVTDAYGHSIRTPSMSDGEADFHVLAIGDSFVEAAQVEYDESMTALLEMILSEQMGMSVTVTNAGVSGWDCGRYVRQARAELERQSYDLVLVFIYSPNDIREEYPDPYPPRVPTLVHRFSFPDTLSKDAIIDDVLYPINDVLERHSHLFMLIKKSGKVILAKLGLTAYFIPETIMRSFANDSAWATTVDMCARIATDVTVPVVYIHLPGSYQVDPDELDWYVRAFDVDMATIDIDQPSMILEREFEARGLTFIDTTFALREAAQVGNGKLYGEVDKHFSPDGHNVAAQYIAEWLLEQGPLSEEP